MVVNSPIQSLDGVVEFIMYVFILYIILHFLLFFYLYCTSHFTPAKPETSLLWEEKRHNPFYYILPRDALTSSLGSTH